MDGIPADLPWSPLFETAELRLAGAPPPPLGPTPLEPPARQACWPAAKSVDLPLALPPPWTGTVRVSVPKGCRDIGFEGPAGAPNAVILDSDGLVLEAAARLDGRVVWREQVSPRRDPDALGNVFGGISPALILSEQTLRQDELRLILGDPLPWTRGEDPYDDFAEFVALLDLDLATLARRTARSPYAGAALEAMRAPWPGDGPTAPARAALREAIRGLDPDQLTPDQRQARSWWLEALTGPTSAAPAAGTATLIVDVNTLEIDVAGVPVLKRDMRTHKAIIQANPTATQELSVPVPTGEALWIRTTTTMYAAGAGSWLVEVDEAWTGLVPGGRYEIRLGQIRRVAPPGTTCVAVEGAPEGTRLPAHEHAAIQRVEWPGDWPRDAVLRPVEAGLYTVRFQPEGMPRVAFTPGGCPTTTD